MTGDCAKGQKHYKNFKMTRSVWCGASVNYSKSGFRLCFGKNRPFPPPPRAKETSGQSRPEGRCTYYNTLLRFYQLRCASAHLSVRRRLMHCFKLVALTAFSLIGLAAVRPSQAQWSLGGYVIVGTPSVTPTPNPAPSLIGPGFYSSTPSVWALIKVRAAQPLPQSCSVSVHYSRTATWTGPVGSTPTPITPGADGVVQGISTAYDLPNSASCSSTVGAFLNGSVTATIANPSPPNYFITGSITSMAVIAPSILSDFVLTADAQGYQGYSTAQGNLTFTP